MYVYIVERVYISDIMIRLYRLYSRCIDLVCISICIDDFIHMPPDIIDMIDDRYSIKVLRYSHVNISRYDNVIYE